MTNQTENAISGANITKAWIATLIDTHTWKEIGEQLGVSAPIAWQFYHKGFIPRNNDLRGKLGLPLLCPRCGMEIT